ncbi:MAG: hypothetical protein HY722_07240, partial [Planctomycetes bacterium]|nr:hypothetical protein [Planctomycetota bacterium]
MLVILGTLVIAAPPNPPTGFGHAGITPTSITWNWTDGSSNESQFVLHDDGEALKGIAQANATAYTETGLLPNSPYTRHVHAEGLGVGDGSDGPFSATVNQNLAAGTYDYSSFNIDAGVTVTVTGTIPLVIRCTGAVTINGTLELSGQAGGSGNSNVPGGVRGAAGPGGSAGGEGGGASDLPYHGDPGAGAGGAGGGTTAGSGQTAGAGGGGGFGLAGGAGANGTVAGGAGGTAYGDAALTTLQGGSGGGGGGGGDDGGTGDDGGGGGGGGGGAVSVGADTITIGPTGLIRANGGDGGAQLYGGTGAGAAGGGGSGGAIKLVANTVTNDGSLSAAGGLAGAPGGGPLAGGGGDGRIRIEDSDGAVAGGGTASPAASLATASTSSGTSTPSGSHTAYTACNLPPAPDLTVLSTSSIRVAIDETGNPASLYLGTGANGAYSATVNQNMPAGTYDYTSFYIAAGVTVTVTGTVPLVIKCTGALTIDGTLDLSGLVGGAG